MFTADKIRKGMALAFFASAYAELAEESGTPLRGEIMAQLPAVIDPSALHAADTLAMDMERRNGSPLDAIYYANTGGLEPREWGHYAALQAMGHGVGLWAYDIDGAIVPSIEFGSYSLSRDYFAAEG